MSIDRPFAKCVDKVEGTKKNSRRVRKTKQADHRSSFQVKGRKGLIKRDDRCPPNAQTISTLSSLAYP